MQHVTAFAVTVQMCVLGTFKYDYKLYVREKEVHLNNLANILI